MLLMDVRTSPQLDQLQSRLARMPPELLDRITSAENLSTPDLGALRLTCKLIERRLFPAFATEFFSKKQFMITFPSLQALVDISKTPDLVPYVREVQIGLDKYGNDNRRPNPGYNIQKILNHCQGQADQNLLIDTGFDRDLLVQAFRNLPNLTKIVIRDNNSANRLRDLTEWRSYGAWTVSQETGLPLVSGRTNHLSDGLHLPRYTARIFTNVLYALAAAGCTPDTFEFLLRSQNGNIDLSAFHIPDHLKDSILPVLAGLKTLHLNLLLNPDSPQSPLSYLWYNNRVRQFLTFTSNLTELRLNFRFSSQASNRALLRWLARDPATIAADQYSPPHITLKLRQLDIGQLGGVDGETLAALFEALSDTLEGVTIFKVNLEGDYAGMKNKINLWKPVLRRIGRLPNIRKITLQEIAQVHPKFVGQVYPGDRVPIVLWPTDADRASSKRAFYSGNYPGEFLEKVASSMEVRFPDIPDTESEDEIDEDGHSDVSMSEADEDEGVDEA